MPAEFEPHAATIICWPARDSLWGEHLEHGERATLEVVAAVARSEPVMLVASPARYDAAAQAVATLGLTSHPVELVGLALDDSWARDTGPIGVITDDGVAGCVDFRFNGWGAKYVPFDQDDALGAQLAQRLGRECWRSEMVLEGGSIAVDGRGTCVTTEQCLLNPNRNPQMSRDEIEFELGRWLGVSQVVWLPLALDDRDTDGHVDLVCAAAPHAWIFQNCADTADLEHQRLALSAAVLRNATDAAGERLRVVELAELPYVEVAGERLAVPYLNFYVGNSVVVVPVTGHPYDTTALEIIGEQFAGRDIVPVDGTWLAFGGGGPHCITQQVPITQPVPAC